MCKQLNKQVEIFSILNRIIDPMKYILLVKQKCPVCEKTKVLLDGFYLEKESYA